MKEIERKVIRIALEAAYDTLKQSPHAYLDQSDFEADRLDAVEKLLNAMKVIGLAPESVSTGLEIASD